MEGYAPGFAGCIYRLLLEELHASAAADRLKIPPQEVSTIYRQNAERVAPYLPPAWVATLQELSARPVREAFMAVGVIDHKELQRIIQRDLSFAHLNESVVVE